MPRGRYQQKQWDERQSDILEALESLSLERGFASVTMDDVADAVGISKATLYQHFASKDDMLAHLMARHEDLFIAWLDSSAGQPPVERLRHTLRYLMEGHITPLRGLVNLSRDEALPVFYSSPEVVARHEQILEQLSAIVRQGQAEGSIAADVSPVAVISAMLALSSIPSGTQHAAAGEILTLFERSLRPA